MVCFCGTFLATSRTGGCPAAGMGREPRLSSGQLEACPAIASPPGIGAWVTVQAERVGQPELYQAQALHLHRLVLVVVPGVCLPVDNGR